MSEQLFQVGPVTFVRETANAVGLEAWRVETVRGQPETARRLVWFPKSAVRLIQTPAGQMLETSAWWLEQKQIARAGERSGWHLTRPLPAGTAAPARQHRDEDQILGDLAGAWEARTELQNQLMHELGYSLHAAKQEATYRHGPEIARLEAELKAAQSAAPARPVPAYYRAILDEGAACYYDGEREIAAGSWELDADDPQLWAKIEAKVAAGGR